MHYILDGNNIIKHKTWSYGNKNSDERHSLITALEHYRRLHPSVRFTVVFDGWSDALSRSSNITIVWSHDQSADDVIIRKISSLGKDAIVVSNDNQIRKKAKFAGLKSISVEEFLSILEPAKQKKQPAVDEEKTIPYKYVPAIKNELEKYYEENPPETDRIRKIRKRIQRFF
ncbi:MAG: NYN domain-containing protein [Candidatus Omnitrophica bacterium]|nr:NYN domain-containing protein [Candidatus Omnitrophota bacterium]